MPDRVREAAQMLVNPEESRGRKAPRAPARARLSLLPSGPGEVHGISTARGVSPTLPAHATIRRIGAETPVTPDREPPCTPARRHGIVCGGGFA